MEKPLENVTIFEDYHHRQVVLNYYQDEDFLWKRDGFHFAAIQVKDRTLVFIKENGPAVQIMLNDYQTSSISTDFQDYFIFRNGKDRLEIYFPH
ncbi:hypothetical protein [Neobacillus mesonae]|uniref:hypothetical protein n=1 Tax=Neobacillus mesonae TaxID=1193713 RepID=UPI0020419D84|nr:hypothetical protein [Neobacillus mesonae]MCM3569537.1 hypothetical protein [Neobacillus mesonae]